MHLSHSNGRNRVIRVYHYIEYKSHGNSHTKGYLWNIDSVRSLTLIRSWRINPQAHFILERIWLIYSVFKEQGKEINIFLTTYINCKVRFVNHLENNSISSHYILIVKRNLLTILRKFLNFFTISTNVKGLIGKIYKIFFTLRLKKTEDIDILSTPYLNSDKRFVAFFWNFVNFLSTP